LENTLLSCNNLYRIAILILLFYEMRRNIMISTFNASAHRLSEGLQVEASARSFKVLMDEPVEGGGTDKGMNPVELMLSAYGGCMTILATMMAPDHDVQLDDFYADLEGDLDMDEGSEYNGFQEIRVTFHVKSSSPKENIDKLAQDVEASCPIGNTLREKVNIVFKGVVME
jgi:uncharacterized OsmC-like protein